jgi:hypothetical protein
MTERNADEPSVDESDFGPGVPAQVVYATYPVAVSQGDPGPVPAPGQPPIKNIIKSNSPSPSVHHILPDGTIARTFNRIQVVASGQQSGDIILQASAELRFSVISHWGQKKISRGIWLEFMANDQTLWTNQIGHMIPDASGFGHCHTNYDKVIRFPLRPDVFMAMTHIRFIILDDHYWRC